jgi:hypothetical protein
MTPEDVEAGMSIVVQDLKLEIEDWRVAARTDSQFVPTFDYGVLRGFTHIGLMV